jgi:hypothetical protein
MNRAKPKVEKPKEAPPAPNGPPPSQENQPKPAENMDID